MQVDPTPDFENEKATMNTNFIDNVEQLCEPIRKLDTSKKSPKKCLSPVAVVCFFCCCWLR